MRTKNKIKIMYDIMYINQITSCHTFSFFFSFIIFHILDFQ